VTRSVVGRCKCPHKAPLRFFQRLVGLRFVFWDMSFSRRFLERVFYSVRVNLAPVLMPMKMAWAIRTGARLSVLPVSQNVGSGVW